MDQNTEETDVSVSAKEEKFGPKEENSGPTDGLCSSGQTKTSTARVLTPEELKKLNCDRALVSDFKQLKLEKEAQKNWDLFYKRNSTNFFKDRHWTTREFEELKACRQVRNIINLTKIHKDFQRQQSSFINI